MRFISWRYFRKTGMLEVVASSLLRLAKGVFGTVLCTMVTCTITNIIAGEQYLSIVIPGRMYNKEYKREVYILRCCREL